MSCNAKCQCASFKEHIQGIGVLSDGRSEWTKTTTHQTAPDTSVDVTQHYDGRQDVTVHAPRIVRKLNVNEVS